MIIGSAELKRRNLRRLDGVREGQVYLGPEIVTLESTNTCNLSCQYCWGHSLDNPHHSEKARFLSWERFVGIVRDCVDLKVDQIHITAAGEATIHPLFGDMMGHLEQQPLYIKVFSNGTFPLEYCAHVIKADHVTINVSAVNRKQYRQLQGQDLFDRVLKNIERLVALRDSGKPKFIVEIAYIVNALNIQQKQKMSALASRLGVNSVYFSAMDVHAYNQKIALPAEGQKRMPGKCLNGWFFLAVKLDGHASSCYRVQMRLGNDKMSLKQLWLSGSMMNMRLLGKYGEIQKIFKACQKCPAYDDNIKRSRLLARSHR